MTNEAVAAVGYADVEAFHKKLTAAGASENVGLILEGIDKHQVLAGDVISR